MIDTVIFDLDGTLLNTLEDLKNSTNFALKKFGFSERTLEEVRIFVGNGLRRLIEQAVPEETDGDRCEQGCADGCAAAEGVLRRSDRDRTR